MDGDLVRHGGEVHGDAKAVLDYWFSELEPKQQFAKDDAVDAAIKSRFAAMVEGVAQSEARDWRETPDTLLAAIILLDQFSRNIYRGTAAAFANDALALELTLIGIERGWDADMAPERAAFLYMPLMHAEDPAMQRLSMEKFTALGRPENLRFAMDHAVVIEQYGRYPSRNAALGRTSTQAELDYLAKPGAGW